MTTIEEQLSEEYLERMDAFMRDAEDARRDELILQIQELERKLQAAHENLATCGEYEKEAEREYIKKVQGQIKHLEEVYEGKR